MSRKKNYMGMLLVVPGVLFVVFFMLVPLFSLCFASFFPEQSFSLSSYFSLFQNIYFQQVFLRSLRLSLLSTAVCAVLGFPTAYYISKHSKHKGMMMAFAVFPMFTSPVIRSFSWMVILGKRGIVNNALVAVGLFAKPQSLLYNEFSMTVGFVQLFLPQMILSLIGVMDNIQDDLTLAAGNLGATKLGAFFHIVFPLSISGLVTGSVLVFTGCMTAYTTPQLLGGTDTRVLSTMVYQYAMSLRDWTQASVVAIVMIVVTMVVSSVFNSLSRKINPMA
ncbi:MAG: ABC transporter permease [Clostridia bacterium]|nr:ABC transporter permease [Clostridia bacterium]